MKGKDTTKEEVIRELAELRRGITELETAEAEHRQTEEALRESEKKYQLLMQQSSEAIYIFDPESRLVLESNLAFQELLGYTAEETCTLEIYDFIAHEREDIDAYASQIISSGATDVGERLWRRKDGTLINMLVIANKLSGTKGDIIFVIGRDITERKRVEIIRQTFTSLSLKLAESDTPEAMAEPIAKAVDELLDYDAFLFAQRLPGSDMFKRVYAVDVIDGKRQVVKTDDVSIAPYRPLGKLLEGEPFILNRKPDEDTGFWSRFGDESRPSASLLFAPICVGREVYGLLSAQSYKWQRNGESDLTLLKTVADTVAPALRRVQAEALLRESEEKYRILVENINDGIGICQRERFIFVNRRFAEMLGYEPEELLMKNYREIYAPESVEIIQRRKELRARGEEVPARFETVFRKKDGTLIDIEANASIIDYKGDLATFIVIRDITERKRMEAEIKQSLEKLQRLLEETVNTLASAVEKRDPYIAGHQQRVAQLASAIAREMHLSEELINGLKMTAVIHDIGKIYLPAEILSKPGKLTEIEFAMIKTHSQFGHDILKTIEFPWPVAQIVLQHHERMNSSGYPNGLSGEDILLAARILAVADVVEAMSSHRPYRPAHGIEGALAEIAQKRGILYDPEVVDACLRLFTEKGFKFEI